MGENNNSNLTDQLATAYFLWGKVIVQLSDQFDRLCNQIDKLDDPRAMKMVAETARKQKQMLVSQDSLDNMRELVSKVNYEEMKEDK